MRGEWPLNVLGTCCHSTQERDVSQRGRTLRTWLSRCGLARPGASSSAEAGGGREPQEPSVITKCDPLYVLDTSTSSTPTDFTLPFPSNERLDNGLDTIILQNQHSRDYHIYLFYTFSAQDYKNSKPRMPCATVKHHKAWPQAQP
jgi:hypothetical protein